MSSAVPQSNVLTPPYRRRVRPHEAGHELQFNAQYHSYSFAGRPLVSVSKFLSSFKKPFDAKYWSARKAAERGVDPSVVLKEWDAKRDASCALGHAVHEIAEVIAAASREPGGLDQFSITETPLLAGYAMAALKAYRTYRINPHCVEFKIFDPALGIAGTTDLVCDVMCEDGQPRRIIADWKTNEKIEKTNTYKDGKMLPPVEHLPDCHYFHYAIQLSLYRFLIERYYEPCFVGESGNGTASNTEGDGNEVNQTADSLEISGQAICHLRSDGTYEWHWLPYLRSEVVAMLSVWQRRGTK